MSAFQDISLFMAAVTVSRQKVLKCMLVGFCAFTFGGPTGDVEPPVVVLQSFPSLAAENALFVIVTGLVPSTVSGEVE